MGHILIVEDDASMRSLIRTVLESDRQDVFEAQDGQAALDRIETTPQPFELIILDLLMPKMDGLEFLSILQNQPRRPPVLILSAHSDRVPPALEHLLGGRLNKPFGRQELIDIVESLIGENTPFHDTARYIAEKVTNPWTALILTRITRSPIG